MITYYAAHSMDGLLAGPDDELDWLAGAGKGGEGGDYGYASFLARQNLVVMGQRTWSVCDGFPQWPYGTKSCFVLSRAQTGTGRNGERFEAFDPDLWRSRGLENPVYLVGGGEIARLFLEHDLLDRLVLSAIPVLLGGGRPLFHPGFPKCVWRLESSAVHPTGVVQSTWMRSPSEGISP